MHISLVEMDVTFIQYAAYHNTCIYLDLVIINDGVDVCVDSDTSLNTLW